MRELPKSQDSEPAFALHLFTATRHACHDLMELRRPAQPGEPMPVTRQEDIREANMRLPEHQREALALRELEQLPYEEIAPILETSPHSVAKLISRARINLSDDLHGTTLAAVAAPSAACERALPLIAAREDGQLEAGSDDDAWLDAHLAACERCGLAVAAMREAGASYRAWPPIAALPWLLEETMAKAAALAGVDWSVEIAEGIASRTEPRPTTVTGQAELSSGGEGRSSRGRRRAIAAAGLAALLLGGGVAAAMVGEPTQVSPRLVADAHSADGQQGASKSHPGPRKHKPGSQRTPETGTTTPEATTVLPPLAPVESGEGGGGEAAATPAGHHQASGVQPPEATGAPKPKQTPKPASQPAPAPAPPAETQAPVEPVVEETPENPSKGKGKGPSHEVPKGGH